MNNKQEKILEKIKKYCENYGAKKTILNFEEDILKLNSPNLSYYFACDIEGSNIKAHEQVVLESKDPEWCYYFALNIKEANIKALEQVVLESKKTVWCRLFSENIKGADICALEQVANESEYPEQDYDFEKLKVPKYSKEERDTKDIKRLGLYALYIFLFAFL